MDNDQTTTTRDQDDDLLITNYILNSFSILSSLLLIATIIIVRIKGINCSNRTSLCLIMYISITEIFFSISQMFRTHHFTMWVSYLSSWGYILSTLLICSLTMSILINIQLTLAYNYKSIIRIKEYYLIISTSFAIILSVFPLTFDKFKFNQERNYFWYETAIWEWFTYTGWITFFISYYITIIIYMYYRNSQLISSDLPSKNTLSSHQSDQSELVSKYISHIILYSLIPILSYLPTVISNLIHYYTKSNFFILNLLSLIFISSQGIFTLIIFLLFDPIVDEIILEHKRNIDHKKHVLDNIQKGVYADNIKLELPSSKNQNGQQNNQRRSIYGYAINAKDRISILTYTLCNRKKNVDIKMSDSINYSINLDSEIDDILSFF